MKIEVKDMRRGTVFYEVDMGMVSPPLVAVEDASPCDGGHEFMAARISAEGGLARFFAADGAGPYAPRLYPPGEYPNTPAPDPDDVEAALGGSSTGEGG